MTTPYAAYSYVVRLANGDSFGGFSEVSGLASTASRRGVNIILKRGLVNSAALAAWLRGARASDPSAKQTVTVTMFDAAKKPLQSWTITGALPAKYTGPALGAKGGEVAMEELQLSGEGIDSV